MTKQILAVDVDLTVVDTSCLKMRWNPVKLRRYYSMGMRRRNDRMKVLEGFDLSKRILFDTPYTQDVEIDVAHKISVWDNSVVELIKNNYL